MSWRLLDGDCVEVMRELPDESIDAIVTDPPYGLEFMGKEWDSFKTGRAEEYKSGGKLNKEAIAERRGKGGAGPSYVNRPAKRCGKCGKQAWSGSPCQCEHPSWQIDNSPLHAFQAWTEAWAREAYRVLKPGGHLLAFGGSRTYHRLACAVEDAGFEVRDQMMWLYGSGFPKSLDVSKAIDKAAGAERQVVGSKVTGKARTDEGWQGGQQLVDLTAPATPEAEKWEGWGTALKPAHEPIVVARKPLAGTVAANVLEFGTGALNIDGCRIKADDEIARVTGKGILGGSSDGWDRPWKSDAEALERRQEAADAAIQKANTLGRWPANVILDEEAGRLLDEQSGERPGGAYPVQRGAGVATGFGEGLPTEGGARQMGDTGGASRFFYCPKASKGERNAGLDGFPLVKGGSMRGEETRPDRPTNHPIRANHHPTVKPIELMRYLCRLVTPPGGTVLDPFTGSGTTGCAAVLEGFDFIGVEREAEYAQIAKARIAWWEKHQAQGDTDDIMRAADEREETEQAGQLGLLDEAA